MTSKLILILPLLSCIISLGGQTAKADPAANSGFSLSPTGLAPLGLPDRDVVRDPYNALLGGGGAFSGLLPQNVGVVGPNLGLGVGFSPGLILGGGGGGGGGGIPTTFGMSAPLAGAPAAGSSNPGSGVTLPLVVNTGGLNPPTSILPPSGSSSLSNLTLEQAIDVPSVPDGGHSAIMLGAGLLMAFAFQRRFSRQK